MSDPKRATLITVGASKSAKNNVNKTVRLGINLDESNESKYPELNYKELVITEERKKKVENGKTSGLDPFSDNDDDVERVARKFEQKYGGKSTYGRKGRSKQDDFADIGAGYDENDSFIDNTHGYDEMIPPECDTLYGGFYINSGSLEFKTVPQDQSANSDEPARMKNKRRISSSSSEVETSDSSSESESQDEKEPKHIANGTLDSHNTEHRKKKNKKIDKKKAKKIRRTDSSAATSGKQTSDDNVAGDGESADSRTSQSDSLTSKPGPSSENAVTSDSSRDTEAKLDMKLPQLVVKALEALESSVAKQLLEHPTVPAKQLLAAHELHLVRIEQSLKQSGDDPRVSRASLTRAARALGVSRAALKNRTPPAQAATAPPPAPRVPTNNNKKHLEDNNDDDDLSIPPEKEAEIEQILKKLQILIDERKADLIANYNAECQRVQEERKKQCLSMGPVAERRLPKRRFPWCGRARHAVCAAARAAGGGRRAAALLAQRVLPMFPPGFVRMPTLLKQADLSKDIKVSEMKRRRLKSASQVQVQNPPQPPQPPPPAPPAAPTPSIPFPEQIQFPSSLTVTTTVNKTSPDRKEPTEDKFKSNSMFGSLMNSFSLSKDLIVEKEKKDDKKEDPYIPPNNIGSITITPVPSQQKEKKPQEKGFIRVKSPAALNEMAKKEAKTKKTDKIHNNVKDKRVHSPLHIDTNFQSSKKDPSPKTKDEITQKQIESLRNAESNIPRPALVPVHHSPTFAKPDKRPPEVKKKKECLIVSDVDPLSDLQEPLAVDDSSSDVEVIEVDKSVSEVPSKDKQKDSGNGRSVPKKDGKDEECGNDDIHNLMRSIREMEYSQETKYNSNSHGGVIANAKHESSTASGDRNHSIFGNARTDKFAERTSLNKTDGCNNAITG